MQTMKELKWYLRANDFNGDPWGAAMGAFFQVASHLYAIGVCPPEWGFSVGFAGNYIDPEDSLTEFLSDKTAGQLEEMGNYLDRIVKLCEAKGLNY